MRGACSRRRFSSVLSSLGLSSVGDRPTNFQPGCTPTLIDLVLTTDVSKISTFQQISTGFSHHDLILTTYRCNLSTTQPNQITYRDFSSVDMAVLESDVENCDWGTFYSSTDVDFMVSWMNDNLRRVMDSNVPLRTRSSKCASINCSKPCDIPPLPIVQITMC